jgi:polygalacturonase
MPEDNKRRNFMKKLAVTAALAVPAAGLSTSVAEEAQASRQHDMDDAKASCPGFTVMQFGAIPDGKTYSTEAIQKAIDACAAAGGGRVIISAGKYLTNALFLKSNVHVEIEAGATLLFTTDFDSVPTIQGRWEGIDRKVWASMFTGQNLENISITGRGTIDGQGAKWWDALHATSAMRRKMGLHEREQENPADAPLKYSGRPHMINLYDCKHVLISGITVQNSPAWNIHPVRCDDVVIDGVKIWAPANSPNTDGIDPDSCKNVRISNCTISVGDDCIVIKSGYRYEEDGVSSENIAITNCTFYRGHCGVGIGSETSGGVKNVVASNCICDGTAHGLRFKTARGRGRSVENVRASNWVMRNVGIPMIVTGFYTRGDLHEKKPVNKYTPKLRNIHLSEIVIEGGGKTGVIEGLPEMPAENITFANIVAEGAKTGIVCTNATGLVLENIVCDPQSGPAVSLDSVSEAEITRVSSRKPNSGAPVIRVENVSNCVVESCVAAQGTGTFLEVKGKDNKDLSLFCNRLSRAVKEVDFAAGASESVIVKRL